MSFQIDSYLACAQFKYRSRVSKYSLTRIGL